MLARLGPIAALSTALALATLSACVPKIKTRRVENGYPLRDFVGPDSLPAAPEGTLTGVAMQGSWRVTGVQHVDGEPSLDHLFRPAWHMQAGASSVSAVQGVPPEWLLPGGAEWRLNRVDDAGLALGFGFKRPRGNLAFLHYAFVAAPVDGERALGIEALHFEDARTGFITWSIWEVTLERVARPPDVVPVPPQVVWPE